jgi:hypothetical protein
LFTDHHPPAPGLALVCPAYGAPNGGFHPAFIG